MSEVAAEALPDAIARYGPTCHLLTTSDDLRPHSTAVEIRADGDGLVCGLGRRTAINALERPLVALLWPTTEPGGYSLIVDGEMSVTGEPGGDAVGTIRATRAVLHRPAPAPDDQPDAACGSDCVPIAV